MSKNKTTKLNEEEKRQLAVIEEIEAILSVVEKEKEASQKKDKRQQPVINTRANLCSSPYLLDLKNLNQIKNNKKDDKQLPLEDRFFLSLENAKKRLIKISSLKTPLFNFKKIKSLTAEKISHWSKKAKALVKKTTEIHQAIKTEDKKELKKKAVKHIKKSREKVAAINQVWQQTKKVETPFSVFLKIISAGRRLSLIWSFYFADIIKKAKKRLRGLMIFDLLSLILFLLWRIIKFAGNGLFLTAKKLHLASIAIWFYQIIIGLYQLLILGMKKIWQGRQVIIKRVKKLFQQSRDLAANAGNEISQTAGKIKDWSPRQLMLKFSLKFLPPLAWPKQLVLFILAAIILVLPLKGLDYLQLLHNVQGKVLGVSEQAAENLKQAAADGSQLNFFSAADQFSRAAENFAKAQTDLEELSELLAVAQIIPTKKAQLAADSKNLLLAAESAAKTGELLTLAMNSLRLGEETDEYLTDRLDNFLNYARQARTEFHNFSEIISAINADNFSALGNERAQKFSEQINFIQNNNERFSGGVDELVNFVEVLQIFLGQEKDTRYLVVFQNNAEMRASGGFIGSFALVDFNRGKIKQIETPGGGSYDLQGGLHKRVAAPQPLHLINSLWEFQDANWWPDWPRSAEKLGWFFENGWGSTVDGVIGITPTYFEELLKIIGPIDMTEKYGVIIDSNNFYDVVQTESENKQTDTPKKIIGDLMDNLLAVLPERLSINNLLKLAGATEKMLTEKHILFYFNDERLQNFVANRNWDGRMKETTGDYLSIINTNIAGGKSDRVIRQTINHSVEVMPDGSIINTVKIKREHTAVKNQEFAGVRNVDYLRVYVPKGSSLIEAYGFNPPDEIFFDEPAVNAETDQYIYLVENIAKIDENSGVKIYEEFNKTVFADWTQVDPGQTIEIIIKYKLPFKIKDNQKSDSDLTPYILYVQKQSGSITSYFFSELSLPKSMSAVWHSENINTPIDQGWRTDDELRIDQQWATIIKNK